MEPGQLKARDRRAEIAVFTLGAVFYGVPMLAFAKNAVLDWSPYALTADFFRILLNSLVFAFVQAGLSSVIACVCGVALGWGFALPWATGTGGLRATLRGLSILYFTLPGVIVASLVIELFRSVGALESGYAPVVVAHVGMNVLFIAVTTADRLNTWKQADGQRQLDVAHLHSAPTLFRLHLTFEGALKEIVATFLPLVFIWSVSAFATVLMLGGSPRRATPEVLLFYSLQQDPSATRSFLLLLLQIVLGAALATFAFKRAGAGDFAAAVERVPAGAKATGLSKILLAAAGAVAMIPLGAVFYRAVATVVNGGRRSVEFDEILVAVGGSVVVAALTMIFLRGFWSLLGRASPTIRRAAIVLSGITGTGFALMWSQVGLDRLVFERPVLQAGLLALASALSLVPLLAFWLELRIRRLGHDLEEKALVLGCDSNRIPAEVRLPQCRDIGNRVVALGALLALGELGFAGLFAFDWPLLSSLSKRMALRYDFAGNSALLLLLIAFAASLSVVAYRGQRPVR